MLSHKRLCKMHKPEYKTKRQYMTARRAIEKVLADELNITGGIKGRSDYADKLNELVTTIVPNPYYMSFNDINSGKTLIKELLEVTSKDYKNAFKLLEELGGFTEKPSFTIQSAALAIHFVLGTKLQKQVRSNICVYDTKNMSLGAAFLLSPSGEGSLSSDTATSGY
jgi:hypothetical protein